MPDTSPTYRLRQVAQMLLSLDVQARDAILACLSPEEREAMIASCADPRQVDASELSELETRLFRALYGELVADPARDRTPWTLDSCTEQEHAESLPLNTPESPPVATADPMDALLQNIDPAQLGQFLGEQHPQVAAATLALLEPEQQNTLLVHVSQTLAGEIRRRVPPRDGIAPEILTEIRCELINQLSHHHEQLPANAFFPTQ